MVTFFTIFIILIVVNAGLLIHSSMTALRKSRSNRPLSPSTEIKIYPLDLLSSDYKKAI